MKFVDTNQKFDFPLQMNSYRSAYSGNNEEPIISASNCNYLGCFANELRPDLHNLVTRK
jgi:hypothetical protein